mgnify:CR=1 FL=1
MDTAEEKMGGVVLRSKEEEDEEAVNDDYGEQRLFSPPLKYMIMVITLSAAGE